MSFRVKRSYLPWFVVAIGSALGGCGSDPPKVTHSVGGASSVTGSAGADATLAGTNSTGSGKGGNRFDTLVNQATPGADPALDKKYQACMTYIRTQCERRTKDCGERFSVEDPCAV